MLLHSGLVILLQRGVGICLECRARLGIALSGSGIGLSLSGVWTRNCWPCETPYGNFWRRCSSGQKRDAFGNSSVISLLVGWVVERNGPPVWEQLLVVRN
ncbi:hypothetical protein ACRRTK_023555 [Alexandromys fortis]